MQTCEGYVGISGKKKNWNQPLYPDNITIDSMKWYKTLDHKSMCSAADGHYHWINSNLFNNSEIEQKKK